MANPRIDFKDSKSTVLRINKETQTGFNFFSSVNESLDKLKQARLDLMEIKLALISNSLEVIQVCIQDAKTTNKEFSNWSHRLSDRLSVMKVNFNVIMVECNHFWKPRENLDAMFTKPIAICEEYSNKLLDEKGVINDTIAASVYDEMNTKNVLNELSGYYSQVEAAFKILSSEERVKIEMDISDLIRGDEKVKLKKDVSEQSKTSCCTIG